MYQLIAIGDNIADNASNGRQLLNRILSTRSRRSESGEIVSPRTNISPARSAKCELHNSIAGGLWVFIRLYSTERSREKSSGQQPTETIRFHGEMCVACAGSVFGVSRYFLFHFEATPATSFLFSHHDHCRRGGREEMKISLIPLLREAFCNNCKRGRNFFSPPTHHPTLTAVKSGMEMRDVPSMRGFVLTKSSSWHVAIELQMRPSSHAHTSDSEIIRKTISRLMPQRRLVRASIMSQSFIDTMCFENIVARERETEFQSRKTWLQSALVDGSAYAARHALGVQREPEMRSRRSWLS